MDTPSLSSLLSALFEQEHTAEEAYTVIKREVITPLIIDGRFRIATPKAQRLYGLNEKDLSEGAWQSLCQPLDEFKYSRLIGMARHHSHSIPTRYISRIQKPNGEIVQIIKNAREIMIDGASHWLTHISLATDDPNLPTTADIAASLPTDKYLDFGGILCLAEVYDSLGIDRKGLQNRHTMSTISQSTPDNKGKITEQKQSRRGHALVFGQPVNIIANGQIIFECQSCGLSLNL